MCDILTYSAFLGVCKNANVLGYFHIAYVTV